MEEMERLNIENLKKTFVGILLVALATVLMTYVIFIKEPIGDDVLCRFDGALTFWG